MCKFGLVSVWALPASGFPPEGGRFTPFSPSDKKPEASRACLAASVLVGVRGGRVGRRNLWTLRPPRIPDQGRRVPVVAVGSGVLRRLSAKTAWD